MLDEIKAISAFNLVEVEVEAELGNIFGFRAKTNFGSKALKSTDLLDFST